MRTSNHSENKAIVARIFEEAINLARPDVADALFHPRFVDHNPLPGQPDGGAGGRYIVEFLNRAHGRPNLKIEDIFGEGDRVAVRWSAGRTDEGGPPKITALVILRLENGKVIERWAAFDRHDVAP